MLRSFSHFMSNQNITATSALYHPNLKLLEITSISTNENGRWLVIVFPNWFIGFSLRKKMLWFLKNFITSKIAVLPTYSTSQKYNCSLGTSAVNACKVNFFSCCTLSMHCFTGYRKIFSVDVKNVS